MFGVVTRRAGRFVAVGVMAAGALWGGSAAAQSGAGAAPTDPEATLFLQKCVQCHQGVFSGRELVNTHTRPVESLKAAVLRMQAHTGPLTDKEVADLVGLLQDKEFVFRLEEAKLEAEERSAEAEEKMKGAGADEWSIHFIQNCAICHTVGAGGVRPVDLTHTIGVEPGALSAQIKTMENRVGPMTPAQIQGLTELLKDEKRMDRLAAAGYKPAGGAAGAGASGASASGAAAGATTAGAAGTTTGAGQQAPETTVAAVQQAGSTAQPTGLVPEGKTEVPRPGAPVGGGEPPEETLGNKAATAEEHHGQKFPTGLLVGMSVFTLLVMVGGYFAFVKGEK